MLIQITQHSVLVRAATLVSLLSHLAMAPPQSRLDTQTPLSLQPQCYSSISKTCHLWHVTIRIRFDYRSQSTYRSRTLLAAGKWVRMLAELLIDGHDTRVSLFTLYILPPMLKTGAEDINCFHVPSPDPRSDSLNSAHPDRLTGAVSLCTSVNLQSRILTSITGIVSRQIT